MEVLLLQLALHVCKGKEEAVVVKVSAMVIAFGGPLRMAERVCHLNGVKEAQNQCLLLWMPLAMIA